MSQRNIGMIVLSLIVVGVGAYVLVTHPNTVGESLRNESQSAAVAVPLRVLDGGDGSSMTFALGEEQKNYAVFDEAAFSKMWKETAGVNGKKQPIIDFTKEYVMGVFAGKRPHGGYQIEITNIKDSGTKRVVSIRITEPGNCGAQTTVITNPYQIVAVPISSLELTHTDEIKTAPCPK